MKNIADAPERDTSEKKIYVLCAKSIFKRPALKDLRAKTSQPRLGLGKDLGKFGKKVAQTAVRFAATPEKKRVFEKPERF